MRNGERERERERERRSEEGGRCPSYGMKANGLVGEGLLS